MKHATMRQALVGTFVVALLVLGAAACGGSSSKTSSTTQPPSGSAGNSGSTAPGAGATTTTAAGGSSTGHLGDTLSHPDQNDKSDVETVTLVKVFDPATPTDASNVPDPGSRWVGLEMTFVDNGLDAANAQDAALATGSNGKVYEINADIEGNFTECKSTLLDLKPNQKATFCPGFLLPNGVTITKVGYSLRGVDVALPSDLTWTVP